MNKTYLHDGLYAQFDGERIILSSEKVPTNVIQLDPDQVAMLYEYATVVFALAKVIRPADQV
jgi:hypothetical protein